MQVIILGGGIIGLTMANLLSECLNLKIVIVEKNPLDFNWDHSKYDQRCSAINRATQNIFKKIDIWDAIFTDRVGVYDKMLVWDSLSKTKINFAATDLFEEDLGHIIENRVIHKALWDKLSIKDNVNFVYGNAVELEQHTDFNRLYINDFYLDGALIIGADGANSWLRKAANISSHSWDYKHCALVATIESELSHNNTAMQRFSTDGPLAFLPLGNDLSSSIVWSSSPEKIHKLMTLDPIEFCEILSKEIDYNLGDLKLIGLRASYPLRMLHAKNYIADRMALVGDAAHVVHPLAGQGMNLGVMDVASLSAILIKTLSSNKDIGRKNILRQYERSRKSHNLAVLSMIEVFKRTFEVKNFLFQSLRNSSMRWVNNCNPVKHAMMRFAMGISSIN